MAAKWAEVSLSRKASGALGALQLQEIVTGRRSNSCFNAAGFVSSASGEPLLQAELAAALAASALLLCLCRGRWWDLSRGGRQCLTENHAGFGC